MVAKVKKRNWPVHSPNANGVPSSSPGYPSQADTLGPRGTMVFTTLQGLDHADSTLTGLWRRFNQATQGRPLARPTLGWKMQRLRRIEIGISSKLGHYQLATLSLSLTSTLPFAHGARRSDYLFCLEVRLLAGSLPEVRRLRRFLNMVKETSAEDCR
jgi:hypothetical protein